MALGIIAVGKIAAPYKAAADEYIKRLGRYEKIDIIELPDQKEPTSLSPALIEQLKAREAEAILARLKPQDHVIALCIEGRQWDSEAFAERLGALRDGGKTVVFVIGGSLGLGDSLLRRADEQLSLSALTYPHQLARLVLLEQIYRAHKIRRGERYHK